MTTIAYHYEYACFNSAWQPLLFPKLVPVDEGAAVEQVVGAAAAHVPLRGGPVHAAGGVDAAAAVVQQVGLAGGAEAALALCPLLGTAGPLLGLPGATPSALVVQVSLTPAMLLLLLGGVREEVLASRRAQHAAAPASEASVEQLRRASALERKLLKKGRE